jgi:hypothetical protein
LEGDRHPGEGDGQIRKVGHPASSNGLDLQGGRLKSRQKFESRPTNRLVHQRHLEVVAARKAINRVSLGVLAEGDLVLAHEMPEETPSAAVLWDVLVQAMQYPAAGEPHRPTELQVRPDERWEALRPHLDEIGVGLAGAEELDLMEVVFRGMCEQVCGKPQPGLLDMPGMKPEQVGNFYEAAAGFFRQAPWKKVGYEAAIKVECDEFQSGPRYGVLLGSPA